MEHLKQWLETVVMSLVNNPDRVEVSYEQTEMGVTYTLKVEQVDVGKLIGREGKNIKALRYLFEAVGAKNRIWTTLKLDVPDKHD